MTTQSIKVRYGNHHNNCFLTLCITVYLALSYLDKKAKTVEREKTNVTGQKYTLVLPPSVSHDIHSVAQQIKEQF